MSPWRLLAVSAGLLALCRALAPRAGAPPEIRGIRAFVCELNRVFCALWHGLDTAAVAPLPARGPAILIANHTSGLDSSLLQATCRRVLGFLIAREFYEHPAFHWLCRLLGCIPVRRDGHDLAATRAALRALKQGRVVPIFPEGRINPTSGRTLLEPKPGVAFIVLHARVPVIPAFIWGTPATKHVVKALVSPSQSRIVYGPPIDPSVFDAGGPTDRERLAAVAEQLMDAIRALQAQVLGAEANPGDSYGPNRARHSAEGRAGTLSRDRQTVRGA